MFIHLTSFFKLKKFSEIIINAYVIFRSNMQNFFVYFLWLLQHNQNVPPAEILTGTQVTELPKLASVLLALICMHRS